MVFNGNHKRTEANLIRARQILRESYWERHGGGAAEEELANKYFDQAMKTRPDEAWEVLLKGVLKAIAIHRDLEIFKIDITAAYLNTPMNEWLMLDKDVASVLMNIV